MLDKQMLEAMPPATIFAKGEIGALSWVAVRGGGAPDWAIYAQGAYPPGHWTDEDIRKHGDKVHGEEAIRRLVPCDDEALSAYRM